MKIRDCLPVELKYLIGIEAFREFKKELSKDEDEEFCDRIEKALQKWLDRETKFANKIEMPICDAEADLECCECEEEEDLECNECKGIIEYEDYNYCPWCGQPQGSAENTKL